MTDTLVLLAAAAILPLLLVLFAFVGCTRDGEGLWNVPVASVRISSGSFAAIDKVEVTIVFSDGTGSVTKGPFTFSSPITAGQSVQTNGAGKEWPEDGEAKPIASCTCVLTPMDPNAATITKPNAGEIDYPVVFLLHGEEDGFALTTAWQVPPL